MPFTKVGENDYTSPSGRHFNSAQVRLYYAHGGSFPGEKHAEGGVVNKGFVGKSTAYAEGGAVLGRARDFLKQSDGEDQNIVKRTDGHAYKNPDMKSQAYAKSGIGSGQGDAGGVPTRRTGTKVLKTVKPRG